MAITNLTNTSWYFNETLDHCGISNMDSWELGSYEAEFMINYYATNNYPYTSLYYQLGYADCMYYEPNYDPTFDFVPYEGGMWTDEDCRTIFITGGEDVTNPDLISWLTQNATQVENPTIITDLTNTSWRFNDTLKHWGIGEPDEEDLVRHGRDSTFNASFTSNNTSYTSLSYSLMGGSHGSLVQYSNSESDTVWEGQWNVDPENYTEGWSEGSSWNDEVYRTITITGGDDATNPKFIVWLTKNATQVSIEDPGNTPEEEVKPSATFDLSTLNLPAGEYTIYVKLSAEGYKDSEPSNEVVYKVAAELPLKYPRIAMEANTMQVYEPSTEVDKVAVYVDGELVDTVDSMITVSITNVGPGLLSHGHNMEGAGIVDGVTREYIDLSDLPEGETRTLQVHANSELWHYRTICTFLSGEHTYVRTGYDDICQLYMLHSDCSIEIDPDNPFPDLGGGWE